MFGRILAVALNTYREAVRDRILYGVIGLATAALFFTLVLGELSLHQQIRVVFDVGLAIISVFAVIVAVFLGSSLLFKEIERKTLYVVLPKPIHRWEFLVGKYVGISLTAGLFVVLQGAILLLILSTQFEASYALVFGSMAGLGLVFFGATRLVGDGTRVLIPWSGLTLIVSVAIASSVGVEVEVMLWAFLLTVAEVTLVAAVALLFSSFSTPFLTGGFTIGLWIIGRSADYLATIRSRAVPETIREVMHLLAEVVPNFHLYSPGRQLLLSDDLAEYILYAVSYAALYSLIAIAFAAVLFRRRDFL